METLLSSDQGGEPAFDVNDPRRSSFSVRVLLVDDHPVVRQGIRQILTDAFHDIEVGEADDAEGALREVKTKPWSIVVLDISMPGLSGLDALREFRRERPELPILVLSMHPAEQFARRSISAGAAGYLTKHSGPRELVRAIHTLIEGGIYVGPGKEPLGAPRPERIGARPLHEGLSDREYQVLRMIAHGKTVSQIATEISLSVKTVSTYRTRVLEKMNMRTTAELMRYAILNHLVD